MTAASGIVITLCSRRFCVSALYPSWPISFSHTASILTPVMHTDPQSRSSPKFVEECEWLKDLAWEAFTSGSAASPLKATAVTYVDSLGTSESLQLDLPDFQGAPALFAKWK